MRQLTLDQPGVFGQMGSQELHLIGQDAAIAQNKILPQRGDIRGVEQRHSGLLGSATAFAVIARATSRDHIHPRIDPLLCKGNDVLSGQLQLTEQAPTVRADISVSCKQLAVGQAGLEGKRADIGNASGANDAVDFDDGLTPGECIVPPSKNSNLCPCLPTHILSGIMNHRLLKRDPRLR